MLYVVATPIGNLSDITYRAITCLNSCDYILCEDTRHSSILLRHYGIQKPLKSLHKFNEAKKLSAILEDLQQGQNIALITDAGTPGISDPGTMLIQACIKKDIQVTPIPGPCAAVAALCCSGLDTERFQFYGFLPKQASLLRKALIEILAFPGTTVCYESPNRLGKVIDLLMTLDPKRQLVVAREITKKFEEFKRGTVEEHFGYWSQAKVKGEIVILFDKRAEDQSDQWKDLSPEEHVLLVMQTYHLSRQEAIQSVAKIRGSSKRTIYQAVHRKK